MAKSFLEQFVESPSGMRRYQQERAISEAVGLICKVMEERNISRSELATMLGKSRGWVTQLLDGETNKTIRTIADVLAVLGREFRSSERPIQIGSKSKSPAETRVAGPESELITIRLYDPKTVYYLENQRKPSTASSSERAYK